MDGLSTVTNALASVTSPSKAAVGLGVAGGAMLAKNKAKKYNKNKEYRALKYGDPVTDESGMTKVPVLSSGNVVGEITLDNDLQPVGVSGVDEEYNKMLNSEEFLSNKIPEAIKMVRIYSSMGKK